MITYIKINGFKSFHNFEMEFTPLTVIGGTNASGKSNLFDALLLLSRMADLEISSAFNDQRGEPIELFTQLDGSNYSEEMEFSVEMLVKRNIKDKWGGTVELNNTRLRYLLIIKRGKNSLGFDDLFVKREILEKIRPDDDRWVKRFPEFKDAAKVLKAGGSREPYIQTIDENGIPTIKIRQDSGGGGKATPANTISQTVLGGVVNVDFPHVFAVKEEMKSWQFLQLNPEDLRQPTKQGPGIKDTLTSSGKNMAAVLYRLKNKNPYSLIEITRKLNGFLPSFIEVDVVNDTANQMFVIRLKDREGKEHSSRILSEGTLRLLLLCILEFDEKHNGLLCFEEPENGIHPQRISAMAKLLKDLTSDFLNEDPMLRQVIVNTHSPLLLNQMMQWKDDKKVSVHYASMTTRITDYNDTRVKLEVTKIIPAISPNDQLEILYTEQDRKLTIYSIIKYLESSDFEPTINSMK